MTGRKKRITALAATMGIMVTVQGIAAYQSTFDTAENIICVGNNTAIPFLIRINRISINIFEAFFHSCQWNVIQG